MEALKFFIVSLASPVSSQIYGFLSRKVNLPYHPLDFNKIFIDKKPILGKGKTIEGSISGIFGSIVIGCLIKLNFLLSLKIGAGAVLGDIIESFFKRRLGKKRGEDLYPWDSVDFMLGSIFFAELWKFLSIKEIIYLIVLSALIHPLAVKISKILKIK